MSQTPFIDFASSSNPGVRDLLARHPRVGVVGEEGHEGVTFDQGPWHRDVFVGRVSEELYGLLEIADNNPVVCADYISVPGAAATFALIALAPLAQAGLIADSPVMMVNFPADVEETSFALQKVGWQDGVTLHSEEVELGGVLAATVMVSIVTPEDLDEIDFLYKEQFDRSFYVHRDETSDWSPELVKGTPMAIYRVRISLDSPNSLLTIRLISDPAGKCGAAQVIHAMNIMCGFEETLGIN